MHTILYKFPNLDLEHNTRNKNNKFSVLGADRRINKPVCD